MALYFMPLAYIHACNSFHLSFLVMCVALKFGGYIVILTVPQHFQYLSSAVLEEKFFSVWYLFGYAVAL